MSYFHKPALLVVILWTLAFQDTRGASLEAEKTSETVDLKLYRMVPASWQAQESDYKTRLVAQANVHCAEYPAFCGLLSWENTPSGIFAESLVFASAAADGKDLTVSTYILYPTGANISSVASTQFVLSKTTTQGLIRNIRAEIAQLTTTHVTYIGTEYFGIPLSTALNTILIPIAVALLLIVILIAVGLHCWNKRKDKKKVSKEIASSKVTPIHSLGGATGKNIDTHVNLKGSNVNNTEKESHLSKKVISSTHDPQLRSVNEFAEVDETSGRNTQTLLPLTVDDTQNTHKKHKKHKKKKRKHNRPESTDTGQEQQCSDIDNVQKQNDSQKRSQPPASINHGLYDSDPDY